MHESRAPVMSLNYGTWFTAEDWICDTCWNCETPRVTEPESDVLEKPGT